MAANRLFLHVGTHKTGTSSFQTSLGRNRFRLRKQGYVPLAEPRLFGRPVWRRPRYNMGRLPQAMLRDGVATVARLQRQAYRFRPNDLAKVRDALVGEIARRREPNLILSAEAFTFLRTPEEAERVRDFLDATGRDVIAVVAWRNDDDWEASWRNHIRKKPANDVRNRALPDARRADGAWYFDKAAIRAFWAAFGPLREVDYDAAVAGEGNVIPALYRAMGVDPTGFRVDISRNLRMTDGES